MLKGMTLWIQFTVAAIFIGIAVYLGRGWPRRIILTINALAGGVILFFIIKMGSEVINRLGELLVAGQAANIKMNPVIFSAVTGFGLIGIPLILVFAVRERRRSVVLAIAFALFNLAVCLTITGDASSGLYSAGIGTGTAFFFIFLLEGVSIGALLMKGRPEILYVLGLALTPSLAALAGFNLPGADTSLVVPFAQAAATGFLIFYLPFIMAVGKDQNDVRWQFIGMLTGLVLAGAFVTSLPLLGGGPL